MSDDEDKIDWAVTLERMRESLEGLTGQKWSDEMIVELWEEIDWDRANEMLCRDEGDCA